MSSEEALVTSLLEPIGVQVNGGGPHDYLTGDAAGLATKDMGEGIGPAVASGIRAAESINSGRPYSVDSIGRYSLPGMLLARWLI